MVEEMAFKLGITGQVENMPDKTVRIIGEGDDARLEELRQRIPTLAAPIIVTGIHPVYEPYTGEFSTFDVIRDKDPAKESDERADRAIHLLGEIISAFQSVDTRIQVMDSHLVTMDSHVTSVDSNVKSVDSNVKSVDSNVQSVDSNVKSLASNIKSLDSSVKSVDSNIKSLDTNIKSLDSSVKSMATDIKSVDSGVKSLGADIKTMDSNIGGHFDRLDQKYDAFGASLAQVADDIHDIKGDLRKAVASSESSNP